jgi:hypothetical protein
MGKELVVRAQYPGNRFVATRGLVWHGHCLLNEKTQHHSIFTRELRARSEVSRIEAMHSIYGDQIIYDCFPIKSIARLSFYAS